MNMWRSVAGTMELELTTANPEGIIAGFSDMGIAVKQFRQIGVLTYAFSCDRKDYKKAAVLCKKKGDTLRVCRRKGLYWSINRVFSQPAFFGGVLILLLVFWVPTRVLFVSVSGNSSVPEKQILEAAENCGITFGASRKRVRSEGVKNALLERIPQLQWVGVNTTGCHAVISVREKKITEEIPDIGFPASIVAARDGYVLFCTAEKGSVAVTPGQLVRSGQTLISAYTDCGLCVRAERAKGEIFAQTKRSVECITPQFRLQKRNCGQVRRKISLLLRKKRIFLWKDSGIWEGSCGRMYEEYYITLPGDFRLPVALCVEEFYPYESTETEMDQTMAETALQIFGRRYLREQMVAGQVIDGDATVTQGNGVYQLTGEYTCLEMIGQLRLEQIGEINGKND